MGTPTLEMTLQFLRVLDHMLHDIPELNSMKPIDLQLTKASVTLQEKFRRRKPNIVVSTFHELLDLLKSKVVDLSKLRYIMLDECDELLYLEGDNYFISNLLQEYLVDNRLQWVLASA